VIDREKWSPIFKGQSPQRAVALTEEEEVFIVECIAIALSFPSYISET